MSPGLFPLSPPQALSDCLTRWLINVVNSALLLTDVPDRNSKIRRVFLHTWHNSTGFLPAAIITTVKQQQSWWHKTLLTSQHFFNCTPRFWFCLLVGRWITWPCRRPRPSECSPSRFRGISRLAGKRRQTSRWLWGIPPAGTSRSEGEENTESADDATSQHLKSPSFCCPFRDGQMSFDIVKVICCVKAAPET